MEFYISFPYKNIKFMYKLNILKLQTYNYITFNIIQYIKKVNVEHINLLNSYLFPFPIHFPVQGPVF